MAMDAAKATMTSLRWDVKGISREEMRVFCQRNLRWKPNRTDALWKAMYGPPYVRHVDEASPHVAKHALELLSETGADLRGGLSEARVESAAEDGTRKLLFDVGADSNDAPEHERSVVEAVLIPTPKRTTLCVSSQVGCAMKCQFCRTGQMGLQQNLDTAQIVEQLVAARRACFHHNRVFEPAETSSTSQDKRHKMPHHAHVSNVVFMGMGEPLQNVDAVVKAVDIMTTSPGLQISPNKVTVSTCGLVPQMETFLKSCSRAQLALSLHATTDDVRSLIMPINQVHPLHDLIGLLEAAFPKHPAGSSENNLAAPNGSLPLESYGSRQDRRHVCIEYVMLRGVNDTKEDALRLVQLLRDIRCKVNLIEFNAYPTAIFQASHPEVTEEFMHTLKDAGLVATLRRSRGDDAMAACGQLGQVKTPVAA
uniref:Radical SAM core domain-containing protein n=1 Tax=Picocystis salinarum TaxID=88271 RepID=A0A7S3XAV9_9CHLO